MIRCDTLMPIVLLFILSLSLSLSLSLFAFDHIRPCFMHIFDQAQSFHEILLEPQMCTLDCDIHW